MAGNLDPFLPSKFALRGILANLKAGLALKFQFNPAGWETTQDVSYQVQGIPGWDHPDIIWEHGGARRIKFDLFFDRTQGAVDSHFAAVGIPLIGTEAYKAVIESFLYPQRSILSFVGAPTIYIPPPRGTLILGTRFYDVILEGGQALRDMLVDKLLTPVRLFATMSFLVIEEGTINDMNCATRKALALANVALQTADTVVEVLDVSGVFDS